MTRDCVGCGKRTAAAAARCVHCGFKPAPANRPMNSRLACPTCATPADIVKLAGIEVDRCGRCYGLWFDRSELKMLGIALSDQHVADELRDLLSSLGADAMSTPAAYPKCPVCTHMMQRRIYASVSGVMVNRCDAHGTWVERDAAIRLIGLMRGDGDAELHALEARRREETIERGMRELQAERSARASAVHPLMAPAERTSRISFVFDLFDFF